MGRAHYKDIKGEPYFLISLFLLHHTQRSDYRKLLLLGHSSQISAVSQGSAEQDTCVFGHM